MTQQVTDNPARSRFELQLNGNETAFIDYYRRGDGVIVLAHAEVPEALRGGGVGAQLTAGTLELLRARHEQIVPHCGYVAQFIRRHGEYRDLLAGD